MQRIVSLAAVRPVKLAVESLAIPFAAMAIAASAFLVTSPLSGSSSREG